MLQPINELLTPNSVPRRATPWLRGKALFSALEIRDPYTAGHQTRGAHLARAIAEEIEFGEERMEIMRVAGLIHDI